MGGTSKGIPSEASLALIPTKWSDLKRSLGDASDRTHKYTMYKFLFIMILLLAFFFRLFGINWDEGYHLHPDERMIIMVADRIHLPKTAGEWQTVSTPQSPLNPKFFAYGSFPIYLLKVASWLWGSDNYDRMLFIGRQLSIVFDLGTVILVYLMARMIVKSGSKNKKITSYNLQLKILFPLLSSFFYACSTLPIQSSHFFISDMPLTFLTTLVLYLSLRLTFNRQFSILNSIFLGLSLGLALATKITAILLVVPILTALLIYFLYTRKIKFFVFSSLVILLFAVIAFVATMPYAIIDFPTFKAHTLEQSRMRVDPFVFPFTLQYVNTAPYWYFVKNMVLWGMGLPLGITAVAGTIYVTISLLRRFLSIMRGGEIIHPWDKISILTIFFIIYFLFMGSSAVKFMRYFLPIYPLFCLFGSLFFCQLIERLKLKRISIILMICLIIVLWPIAFTSIYTRTHTRITASEWIYKNVPNEATLGIEHWDDRLPLLISRENKRFVFLEFPLYEADTREKWEMMAEKLEKVDYIIIASNRLYVPLTRLADCNKYPMGRCYPKTAEYYKKLFAGDLGFTKIAEFTSYPTLSIGKLQITINDDSADESFTVYDHPKIMIFKKIKSNNHVGEN